MCSHACSTSVLRRVNPPCRDVEQPESAARQTTVLASKVEDYRDWMLIADCGPCGPRTIAMASLPGDVIIQRLLPRLRCQVCRGRVATAALDNCRTGDFQTASGPYLGPWQLRLAKPTFDVTCGCRQASYVEGGAHQRPPN